MTDPRSTSPFPTATAVTEVITRFLSEGLIDRHSRVELASPTEAWIVFLRTTQPQRGIGRCFLRALKQLGLQIHVRHPVREAMPFWRNMHAEGLIADDPDAVRSWEDFIGAIETQMVDPESLGDSDQN